jgi:hypothetical protein
MTGSRAGVAETGGGEGPGGLGGTAAFLQVGKLLMILSPRFGWGSGQSGRCTEEAATTLEFIGSVFIGFAGSRLPYFLRLSTSLFASPAGRILIQISDQRPDGRRPEAALRRPTAVP